MTNVICILKDVPTTDWPETTKILKQANSYSVVSKPALRTRRSHIHRHIFLRCTERLKAESLPGSHLAVDYLHGKYIKNLSAETIRNAGGTVLAFLHFLHNNKTNIYDLTRRDISAFVGYEQNRGLNILTVISYLRDVYAFINYLVKQKVVSQTIMERKIRLQKPEPLPKAIPSEDIQLLLDAIDNVRNRALLLLLLRTGMRIGELLEVRVSDILLQERKILLYLGEKNLIGRSVYFSEDAEHDVVK